MARLHSFREDGSARYAVGFFDPERLGRGFGTEVTAIVVQYAFGSLGLQRLDLTRSSSSTSGPSAATSAADSAK
jgi:RimJ/RimL family protein N-acetyltransferase